jgi:hypothetical protein
MMRRTSMGPSVIVMREQEIPGCRGKLRAGSGNLPRWLKYTNFESCSAASVLWFGVAC